MERGREGKKGDESNEILKIRSEEMTSKHKKHIIKVRKRLTSRKEMKDNTPVREEEGNPKVRS